MKCDTRFRPQVGDVFRTAQREIEILKIIDDRWVAYRASTGMREYSDYMRLSVWMCQMPMRRNLWKNGIEISEPVRNRGAH